MSELNLILLGPPGSGKGTQGERLQDDFDLPYYATGDILRAAVREGTELGILAKKVMDEGGLLSDEIVIGLVRERLHHDDARGRGYILDGFPRTVGQAEQLDEITGDLPLDLVIDLDVPRDLVLSRISARRVCADCGTNYVATGGQTMPWICDNCGGDVLQRDDDTPEAVTRRLDLYEEQTAPLIEYYQRTGRLAVVDGVDSPEQVFTRLVQAVDGAPSRS